jgi:predicted ATPase/class 3 adenylate cyclase
VTAVRTDLPSGTVTFLFTDIQGSTKLLHELGAQAYADALAEHRRVLREAFTAQGGVEVDTQGDAFFVAFPTAPGALRAAVAATERLAAGPIRVRMALHTGTPFLGPEGYVGVDVHRGARIGASGHGGQVLVSAATAALIGTDGLRDLGLHRLKDLSAPEHIYQVGPDDFPALKTLYQTNLPVPATPFLGRERELAAITGLLSQPQLRLLTLTGPGGTGKTRLALQAAAELSDGYPQGLWWVPLAALREPGLVLETAAHALGAKGGLAEHIGDRSMLIVFDNFEQVVDAAADLAGLLAACPKLDLLVTSRESLHIGGEQEYPVPPLLHAEGIELFVARARAVRPDFAADAAVSEICRRLDDLPLALELAAARVKALSSKQILERLEQRLPLLTGGARDLPERQRTLRATIAWSHDLLTSDEQLLFARLAVFRGGCTLEAAEAVIQADLDALQSLVDKSLLRQADERFWMLETIREYAAEQLEASDEADDLRRRHAEHFLALAEEAEPHVLGVSPVEWLDRLDRDHDNLRAALDWFESTGEIQPALRIGGAVWEFWCLRGHGLEGWRRLDDLLEADQLPGMPRAKALNGAVHLAPKVSRDAASYRRRAEQALALHRDLSDAWGLALAEFQAGMAFTVEDNYAAALPHMEKGVRRFREVGDEHRALQATRMLAWCHEKLGDTARADEVRADLLRDARAAGDEQMEARALAILAASATDEGRTSDALALLMDAYRIDRHIGNPEEIAVDLIRIARALAVAGKADAAAAVLSRSEAMRAELGIAHPDWIVEWQEEAESKARAGLDDEGFVEAWERGRRLTVDEAVALALESIGPSN